MCYHNESHCWNALIKNFTLSYLFKFTFLDVDWFVIEKNHNENEAN